MVASAVESVTEAMEEERGTKERPTRALEGSNTMDDYVILRPVGEGSFGKVFQARQRYTGRACAMKFIPKHGKNERELESLRSEIDIMKTLDHPNVIKMLDAFETKKEIVVVMEFAQGVLFDVLTHDTKLPECEVREIAIQLIDALHYLHSNRVIHRDLKPENILIGADRCVKVCDFGLARSMSQQSLVMTSIKGTPLYMAPELVQEQPYDHTVDLWSLGVILYELFVGKTPFYTTSMYTLMQRIVKDVVPWPNSMSPSFKSFLQGLLNKKPQQRLNWPSVLDHPFVRKDKDDAGEGLSNGNSDVNVENEAAFRKIERRRQSVVGVGRKGIHESGGASTLGPTLGDVSEDLQKLELEAHKSVEAAAGLRRDRAALSKLLETLQPQNTHRSKFLPSYISNRTLASKKIELKSTKMADIASALRTLLAMLKVPRKILMSVGGGSVALTKDLPAAVIAACTTAANANDPPQPELLALAIKVVSTVAFPDGSTPWCGLGLNGYLMFLGKLLGYTSRDIGEIVATTASKAIADAIEAAKERGISSELAATRGALGPVNSKGGGVTDALCQTLARSTKQATATQVCRALFAATEIGPLTAYIAGTLSVKKDGTQKLIRNATTKTHSARLLRVVADASEDVRAQAISADGIRILAAIVVDETSKRNVTIENAKLCAAVLRAMDPLLDSRTQHPVVTLLDVGVSEALCLALTVFTSVANDFVLVPAVDLIRLTFSCMPTPAMEQGATEDAMRRFKSTLSRRDVAKTLISRLKVANREAWPSLTSLLHYLVMSSRVFASEFVSGGGLESVLCKKILSDRTPHVVTDWLLLIMHLARGNKENYPLLDAANVLEPMTRLLDHSDPTVRSRACNAIGNVCRHNNFFYEQFRELGTVEKLIERCGDKDRTTRKFATFAIGNAAFHTDELYGPLTAAVDPLMHLLDASEEAKTRSNACAALGNLVRNSSVLCSLMVSSGALDAIINLIAGPTEGNEVVVDVDIVKIAIYSLGNVCRHRVCRERVESRQLVPLLDELARQGDENVKKYVVRLKAKLDAAPTNRSSSSAAK